MRHGIGAIRLAGLLACLACGRPVDVQFQVPPTTTPGGPAQAQVPQVPRAVDASSVARADAGSTRRVAMGQADAGGTRGQVPQVAGQPALDDGTLYDAAGRPVRTDVPLFNAAGQRVDPTGRVLTGPMSLEPAAQTVGAGTQTVGAGTQTVGAGTQPVGAGTQPVGAGTQTVGAGTQPVGAGTQPVGAGTQTVGAGTQTVGAGTQTVGAGTQTVGAGAQPVEQPQPPEPPEPEVADEATDEPPPAPPPTVVPILYLWPIFLDSRFLGQGQSGFGAGTSGSTSGYPTPGNPFAPVGVATPSNPLPGFAP
jgi:hypothetical protein